MTDEAKRLAARAAVIGLFLLCARALWAGQLQFDDVPVDITTATGEDLVIAPGEGGTTQIGDKTGGTRDIAGSNDDLFIANHLEVEGKGRVEGALAVAGAVTLSGAASLNGAVTLGDATSDDVTVTGLVASNLVPKTDSTYTLGSTSVAWGTLYADAISSITGNNLALTPISGQALTAAVTRSAATGNEVLVDLAGTVNKATSGNYTGLKLNVTETLAPGAADKLLDLLAGGTSQFQVYNGAVSTANYGLLSVGAGAWDGSTTGFFAGSANGTQIGANAATGFTGNLLDLQVAGTSMFKVDAAGAVTTVGSITEAGNKTITGNLSVNGNTTLGDASTDTVTSNAAAWTFANDTTVALSGGVDGLNFDSNTLSIDAENNRVGIGTASPSYGLEVQSATGFRLYDSVYDLGITSNRGVINQLSIHDNTTDVFLYDGSAGDVSINTLANGNITFTPAGTGKSIFASGNVGIGDTTPDAQLDVVASSATTIGQIIQGAASQTANLQEWQNSGGGIMSRIGNLGALGINVSGIGGGALNVTPSFASITASGFPSTVGIETENAVRVPLAVKGAASQSANLTEWQDSSGNILVSVGPSGDTTIGDGADASILAIQGSTSASDTAILDFKRADGTTVERIGVNSSGATAGIHFYTNGTSNERLSLYDSTEAVFNEGGLDYNFRIEGDTNANLFFVDASSDNVKIAGTAARATTEGTNHLDIFDGTAPVGTLANGISLYSTSGELRVMDAAGNATLLSPHNFSMIPGGRSEPMAWVYYSERDGQVINVDMLKLTRLVERLSGEKLVHLRDLETGEEIASPPLGEARNDSIEALRAELEALRAEVQKLRNLRRED